VNLLRVGAGIVVGGLVGVAGASVIGRSITPKTALAGGLLGATAGGVVVTGYDTMSQSFDDSQLQYM
jgi:hypothetical protein